PAAAVPPHTIHAPRPCLLTTHPLRGAARPLRGTARPLRGAARPLLTTGPGASGAGATFPLAAHASVNPSLISGTTGLYDQRRTREKQHRSGYEELLHLDLPGE